MNAPDLTIAPNDDVSVHPREIEQVIQSLWRDSTSDDGDTMPMQVRTLNLLVIAPTTADQALLQAIDAVAVQHPGRTITMLTSDDAQPPRAQVSLACRFGGNGKTICGEQITIRSGSGGAPLPNIAASLLIAGVPTFVWWHGDPPFDSSVFASFADSADRIVVDSRTWHTPLTTVQQLAAAAHDGSSTAYTDLQWTALTPWRRLIAQCFDLPQLLPQLWQLDQITIEHGNTEADRIAALLLVGWFGSRLGWTIHQVTNERIVFNAQQRSVAVELRAHAGSSLQRVQLHSQDATIDVRYQPDRQCIKTDIRLADAAPIERMARVRPEQLAQQIDEELGVMERDHGFEAALLVVAQLASAPI